MSILFNNNTIKNIYVKKNQLSQEITKGYIKSDGALKQFYSKQNEEHKLPDNYQQVEYIYNNDNAYISTKIFGNYSYECKFKLYTGYSTEYSRTPFLLQCNSGVKGFYTYDSNTYIKYFSKTFNVTKDIGNITNKIITLLYDTEPSHSFIININNTNFTYQSDIEPPEINYFNNTELILFGKNNQNTITAYKGFYIYSFKVYNNKKFTQNNLIADFIPCKRKSDNKIGMYNILQDYLEDKGFYSGSGSGTLKAGPEVNS